MQPLSDRLSVPSLGTLTNGTIGEVQMSGHPSEPSKQVSRSGRNLHQAQETVYRFLLDIVKTWPPEEVLLEFKHLFLYHVETTSAGAIHAVYEIVFSNNEEEFRNTLKRSCYILVNNWDASRNFKPIQELIKVFEDSSLDRQTISPTLKRLRVWIDTFRRGKDYEELKLFASRYDESPEAPWSNRYTSYLLVPQYINSANPIEQREAARALSMQLKDKFKFRLAMYIAKSQSATSPERLPENPTVLGDNVLQLIKTIVAKRGQFSYANLANIFINQTHQLSYKEFKRELKRYLIVSIDGNELTETLQARFTEKLDPLYLDYDHETLNEALILRTCNRIIEHLTTENRQDPSPLFVLLVSQGSPLTLVIVLLKLILICRNARTHLEAQIAELIRYYKNFPEDECRWVVNFLEIFNVTFAIYAENVQYNLIKMDKTQEPLHIPKALQNLDAYRVFSQLKREVMPKLSDEVELTETFE
ncbi:hypothetical protein [Phormidesmis priestleyi]|nr:hypothetical protein [Phormidesmis priestleyi]